jgi:hypothetical protein
MLCPWWLCDQRPNQCVPGDLWGPSLIGGVGEHQGHTRTLKQKSRGFERTWDELATTTSLSRWRNAELGEIQNWRALMNSWRHDLVAGCVTTLWTRRVAQFIACLGGGVQFGRIVLAVERGVESLARWFVAFTVAKPPSTSQGWGAVYGDSPRRGKVLRHVAWPDNGELRWCQRD